MLSRRALAPVPSELPAGHTRPAPVILSRRALARFPLRNCPQGIRGTMQLYRRRTLTRTLSFRFDVILARFGFRPRMPCGQVRGGTGASAHRLIRKTELKIAVVSWVWCILNVAVCLADTPQWGRISDWLASQLERIGRGLGCDRCACPVGFGG